MSDDLMQHIHNAVSEATEARAKWLEAEINKSIVKEGLQGFPMNQQVYILNARGYQQRTYTYNTKTTWGQVVLGEFIPIAEFDVEYITEPKIEASDTLVLLPHK